jgi:hypothetical protein
VVGGGAGADDGGNRTLEAGPWVQGTAGNPLVNEVLIPMAEKDDQRRPAKPGKGVPEYFQRPELANLLPVLYPKQFPSGRVHRHAEDIVAILTGIPAGIGKAFRTRARKACSPTCSV